MLGANCKNIYCRLGAFTVVLTAGSWLVTFESKWQESPTEQGLAFVGHQPSSSPMCGGVNNGLGAGPECVPRASKASRLEHGGAAQGPELQLNYADAVVPAGEKGSLESSQYIDIYDPSTWPADPYDTADLPKVVPIDLYDPQTWPVEINQEVDPAGFQSIDLYDSDTWPSNEVTQTQSMSSAGDGGFDVYDSSTWPQTIGSAASGDAIVPIDPYDTNTWPEQ